MPQPAQTLEAKAYYAAVNALRLRYLANAATIATLAGLAAGATDSEIQALNTAMPVALADLSATFAAFQLQQQVK